MQGEAKNCAGGLKNLGGHMGGPEVKMYTGVGLEGGPAF